MNKTLSPICLFVYSRTLETQQTVESLKSNILALESRLFIFSDGAKTTDKISKVNEVRKYIRTITGFAEITIVESVENKGLANSIISGVTKIVSEYGRVIVLEDDLILATNFLCFMNEALTYYEDKKKVLNVSGYSFTLNYLEGYKYDVAFSLRFASLGWGVWKDRWELVDWEIKDYKSFKWNLGKQLKFLKGGSDLCSLLSRQVNGKIDSWAIRFDYHHFKHDYVDVFPIVSKVQYNGNNAEATHTTHESNMYDTLLDESGIQTFKFSDEIMVDCSVRKQFYNHYSLISRLKDKITQLSWTRKK